MSEIKKGALVKAWDDDISKFNICEYIDFRGDVKFPHSVNQNGYEVFKNAIELPPELVKQLENLGK